MAFLFKSKKNQDRALASRDGTSGSQGSIQSASARVAKDEKAVAQRSTPTGSMNSFGEEGSVGSPEQAHGRQRGPSVDQAPSAPSDLPFRNSPQMQSQPQQQPLQQTQQPPPQQQNPNSALYPWSQRRLTYTSAHPPPFPRYGAAVNSVASKEGDIYLMGGLINSSTVKGDLWMIEAGQSMACYPLATTAEGPGPRVGHSSLLVGNAFIVYGGDTKVEETDVLDETLYLLNTSTRQWSRALPSGPRPSGRYGHSLNILGSKIYVFGGQVEGYFMNDLSAFDLNQLQMPNNRWELLIQNSDSGGPPPGQIPPARTNHSVITYNDKMYLFGGTNGYQWFNDVWCYDPALNEWSQMDCIGYIPVPREGHAATVVDDVMYIFGGRTEEGADLGDLAAFRITSRRWYTFQNMGPSPSPRSGHSMTTVGKQVVVVGGEPSSAPVNAGDLGIVYTLDTTKIRYPNDAQAQQQQQLQQQQQNAQKGIQARRPSGAAETNPARPMASRDGSQGPPELRRPAGAPQNPNGISSPPNGFRAGPGTPEVNGSGVAGVAAASRLPRGAGSSPPAGPPPQGPTPAKPSVQTSNLVRSRGPSTEREATTSSPQIGSTRQSPVTRDVAKEVESPIVNGRRTPTQQVVRTGSKSESTPAELVKSRSRQGNRSQGSVDSTAEPNIKPIQQQVQQTQVQAQPVQQAPRAASPPPPTRQPSNPLSRRSSGRNSQTVVLLKELDSSRNRNAWYASELELARKAGYVPNATLSPVLDSRATETFDDEDKPLIEALLAMRTELASVQSAVDKQAILAAKQIAEAEKQRDAAIQEAVYSRAKLAAHMGGSTASTPQLDSDRDADDHRARGRETRSQLADDTTNASQKRMAELESYKTMNSPELERLKAELHMIQREAREQSVQFAEVTAAMQLLQVEKDEFQTKYTDSIGNSKEQNQTFDSLREAVAASAEMKLLLERLEVYQEQSSREGVAIRRQLQAALRDTQSLQALNSDLKHQLQNQQLETNAMSVQHNTLKDILIERGISPNGMPRSRSVGSPRGNSPEQARIRELEDQLHAAASNHEDNTQRNASHLEATENAYREKLSQLENDYQSAVHYVKGTEKMLKQLKEQLARYKTENARLKSEVEDLEDRVQAAPSDAAPADWETERDALHQKINALQEEVRVSGAQLEQQLMAVKKELEEAHTQRDTALASSEETARTLTTSRRDLEQLQQENSLLVPVHKMPSKRCLCFFPEHDNLRTHWEATIKKLQFQNTFDFDTVAAPARRDDEGGIGLSESLADWRKRLDVEEGVGDVGEPSKSKSRPERP
ncbi:kelch repeat-containing protein [Verticillium alfalfae VaMs.102]|uniref:Kelch repeat-containing protein n=1 Tax=Verticillium alfalfae (strain VaMs.102 / ATCC MYA-4576 / FGSC 10136) TaxID=526221 RepID=C9SB90_VERA1|nr:kelch repeat-containing protein [Verticillium alfalfae VaMs.102]EEY15640.1 kelch repeat-containing protein [Verticillium alfalfae VaMs.102]